MKLKKKVYSKTITTTIKTSSKKLSLVLSKDIVKPFIMFNIKLMVYVVYVSLPDKCWLKF